MYKDHPKAEAIDSLYFKNTKFSLNTTIYILYYKHSWNFYLTILIIILVFIKLN